MANKITFNDTETIVLYGDSITEQNLYAAFIETFLISRFPRKNFRIYNFGWGGDTAPGGNGRYSRDVAPVKPTLLFTNFGMNDGCYCEFTPEIYNRHIDGQKALAQSIRSGGARHVFLTTCPVDYERRDDGDLYNDSLAKQAGGTRKLGDELKLPVVDIFTPMRELQKSIKARHSGFTMIPDSVHPDPVGHLVMAYYVLAQIDGPAQIGKISIDGNKPGAIEGVRVSNFKQAAHAVEFDVELPFIPFYVPPEARRALEFLPIQRELNAFTLTVKGWEDYPCSISVDGKEAAVVKPQDLAAGIDLSSLEDAAWTEQGRTLWAVAQMRWQRHFSAWRDMGFQSDPSLLATPSFKPLLATTQEFVRELSATLSKIAQPRRYRIRLERSRTVPLSEIEFSPAYPYRSAEFDKQFPPELTPKEVEWTSAPLKENVVDLGRHFNNPVNCVSYGRLTLEAEEDCSARLILGSDDGLSVFANGAKVLARDVRRGLRLGDDEVVVQLKKGCNPLLFRVTQFGGAYAFAVKIRIEDNTRVQVSK